KEAHARISRAVADAKTGQCSTAQPLPRGQPAHTFLADRLDDVVDAQLLDRECGGDLPAQPAENLADCIGHRAEAVQPVLEDVLEAVREYVLDVLHRPRPYLFGFERGPSFLCGAAQDGALVGPRGTARIDGADCAQ